VHASQLQQSTFQLMAAGGQTQNPVPITFTVQSVSLTARTGDRPELTSLDLDIGDVDVPASALPPSGLQLRDVALHVEDPTRADVIDVQEDALELGVHTPLTLSWSLVLDDGSLWKLGPASTEALDLHLTILRDATGFTTTVNTICSGECWSVQGVASLRDAQLYVEAAADVRPMN
jgi:hypothetical protein